jgi:hypothetical protein
VAIRIEANKFSILYIINSELGEEFHYLFKCTFFNNVGANFLPRNICNNPNESTIVKASNKYCTET